MSRFRRTDHLWMVGGVLCAAVLLAVSYFFLVSPQHAQRDSLNTEASSAESRLTQLRLRLNDLRKENDKLDVYKTELARERLALPTTSGLSDLLRELQSAGDLADVSVSGLNVGNITAVTISTGTVYTLPLSLSAGGTVPKLNAFLDQLQLVQPRALLIDSSVLSISADGTATLALTIHAFVAPVAGSPTPAPSAARSASPSATPSASPAASRSVSPSAAPSATPSATKNG
jgi:Tfp pilus assembly protein PilO